MANDIVVRAEGLGKKYVIGHEAERERIVALRDVIAHGARNAWRMAADMARGRIVVSGDTVEEFWALKDINFEVKRGEVLGIIGRNGAGKSTLLKVLSRITEPSEGRVTIKGRVASLLEVGTGFHPELTGRENIYLNGAILGMTRAEIKRKFDEIVAFAEVEKFLDTPVKRYSSGMYVRLAFAVAAHLEPEILVVDEVLSVGDVAFQKKSLGKMHDITHEGRTVLFVSHNLLAVKSLCTSGLFLQNGKLCRTGEVDGVISTYLVGSRDRATHDLRDRIDRQGAGATRITRIWMEGSSSGVVDHAASGTDLVIAIEYESVGAEPLKNVRVSLAIQNMYEQPLLLCSTELVSSSMPECSPCGIIRCIIPKFPLSGGTYSLTAYFEVNRVTQDWLSNAANITVEDGDFYGSGKLYPSGWQGKTVLVDHRWEFSDVLTPASC